jgi:hypothetical protein
MIAVRMALWAAVLVAPAAHAQADTSNIPQPPSRELMRFQRFMGSYTLTGHYLGLDWRGSLDVRPAVKGWYVEWEINAHSGPIDRQLRMMVTWDPQLERYRMWRFETFLPEPVGRAEGVGRFEGDEFVQEWKTFTPDGAPGVLRNRFLMEGPWT